MGGVNVLHIRFCGGIFLLLFECPGRAGMEAVNGKAKRGKEAIEDVWEKS